MKVIAPRATSVSSRSQGPDIHASMMRMKTKLGSTGMENDGPRTTSGSAGGAVLIPLAADVEPPAPDAPGTAELAVLAEEVEGAPPGAAGA